MISYIFYRSEGLARTGYFIPGCVGIPGLALAENSSAAVAAAAVVALRAWTENVRHATENVLHATNKKYKCFLSGYKKAPAGTWTLIQSLRKLKVLFGGYKKAPAGAWMLIQSFEQKYRKKKKN